MTMILLVDDDKSVTASLALLLKQAGHASRSAATPDEAIAILRQDPCDLVIQDMNFTRRTSGEEGLALLRLADAKGFPTESDYVLVPSAARARSEIDFEPNAWREEAL